MTAMHLDRPPAEPPSRVSAERAIDVEEATAAAGDFLTALGMDLEQPGLADTPGRMARAYQDLFTPRAFNFTVFPNDQKYRQLVAEKAIPFHSVCEHHALPFFGTADVAYLPGENILGLSKLARVVEHFSRQPQVQERLTMQIAAFIETELKPQGVGVVLRAEHMCMRLRGVQVIGTETITSEVRGVLLDNARARAEFMALTRDAR
ncbi:GTP cyclohydrolase I [Kribbella sp. NPDC023972]|uniref:GTP cyclohydrolase I n=1 Tax=Kribbella sp. NPDC023972 TaxID=3154795 RepID=UPI0033F464B9